eukprot:TRINITY_DN21913_c0_g1_i2.p1 TRINITY_DN21913_c0_g1~~TRINITY_DN21913_c0_g1_i2.p1  ORF type:complete len:623 (-),score=35.31 TRINITY_DN21913_c0_g1_i2:42-1847(-)
MLVLAFASSKILTSGKPTEVYASVLACALAVAMLPSTKSDAPSNMNFARKGNSLLLLSWTPLVCVICHAAVLQTLPQLGPVVEVPKVSITSTAPLANLDDFSCKSSTPTNPSFAPPKHKINHHLKILPASWQKGTHDDKCLGLNDSMEASWGGSPEERCGQWLVHDWGAPAQGGLPSACDNDDAQDNCKRTCCFAKACNNTGPAPFPCGRWYIRGVAYDLNSFIKHHPGGERYLLDSINTDVTAAFESTHIGTTARRTLEKYVDRSFTGFKPFWDGDPWPASQWPANLRYNELKRHIAGTLDLNDLKNPSPQHSALWFTTLASHAGFLSLAFYGEGAGVAWAAHTGMGVTSAWLGAFGHNGIHMFHRRYLDTFGMYLTMCHNPFRWMNWHVHEHHVHSNTMNDPDKWTVAGFQKWIQESDPTAVVALLIGSFWGGLWQSIQTDRQHVSPSMSLAEQKIIFLPLVLVLGMGIRKRGWRFLPRMIWTIVIASVYAFIGFQMTHFQHELLDGDAVKAKTDDFGEYQLRTCWGWGQSNGAVFGLPFLFLNFHPGHHLFPGVHHSKLHLLTPLIRAYYPDLAQDHSLASMLHGMFKLLTGAECKTV